MNRYIVFIFETNLDYSRVNTLLQEIYSCRINPFCLFQIKQDLNLSSIIPKNKQSPCDSQDSQNYVTIKLCLTNKKQIQNGKKNSWAYTHFCSSRKRRTLLSLLVKIVHFIMKIPTTGTICMASVFCIRMKPRRKKEEEQRSLHNSSREGRQQASTPHPL